MTRIEQWDCAVALFLMEHRIGRAFGERHANFCPWAFGVLRRSTKHFRVGDVVLIFIDNGTANRAKVYGLSSRGHRIAGFYMKHTAWLNRYPRGRKNAHAWNAPVRTYKETYDAPTPRQKTALEYIGRPDHLGEALWPDDPAVRRFVVETLLPGLAGRRVGKGTPPFPSEAPS